VNYRIWQIVFPVMALLLGISVCACSPKTKKPSDSSILTLKQLGKTGLAYQDLRSISHPGNTPLPFPIAFTSERDGNREIYITLQSGSPGINISNNRSDDNSLRPYRDGGVFVSERDGDDDIFYVHYDGKPIFENLTRNPATEKQLAVSSDLQELLFTSNREGDMEIFLYSRDGFPPRNLTRNEASDEMPAWMPDNERFLFESDRTGDYDIFIQPVKGGPAKNLTDNPAEDRFPSVSFDGKLMAFESNRDGNIKIYLYKFDGGSVECLSGDAKNDNTPLISHDKKLLAFNHGIENEMTKIMIMDLDDHSTRQVTDYETSLGVSGFSPDDKWLLYSSKRTGNFDVYIYNLETKETINVTAHPGSDYYPVFFSSVDAPFIKAIFEPKSN